MAASMLAEEDPRQHLMDDLVATFRLDGVSLLVPSSSGWVAELTSGHTPPVAPVNGDGSVTIALNPAAQLVARGTSLVGEDENVLRAFGAQLAIALETRRLMAESEEANKLAKDNVLRSGLLSAISHDLRTPLASIKVAATSLLSNSVDWSSEDRRSLLQAIDDSSDRLNAMVADLLDMSRIRAGAVVVQKRAVSIEEVVASLLDGLGDPSPRIKLSLDANLPLVNVDPVLMQRVLVNLVDNALKYSPEESDVSVTASSDGTLARIVVMDHDPGIKEDDRELVFRPFQRTDDVPEGHGVGLGLAI